MKNTQKQESHGLAHGYVNNNLVYDGNYVQLYKDKKLKPDKVRDIKRDDEGLKYYSGKVKKIVDNFFY